VVRGPRNVSAFDLMAASPVRGVPDDAGPMAKFINRPGANLHLDPGRHRERTAGGKRLTLRRRSGADAPPLLITASDEHRERLPEVGALGEAPRGAPNVGDHFQVFTRGEPAPQLLQGWPTATLISLPS